MLPESLTGFNMEDLMVVFGKDDDRGGGGGQDSKREPPGTKVPDSGDRQRIDQTPGDGKMPGGRRPVPERGRP